MSEQLATQDEIDAAELTAELLDAKTPTESIICETSFEERNVWQPRKYYAATSCIVPEFDEGYEFYCSEAGYSGTKPPRFLPINGFEITDGSLTWTGRPKTNASLVRQLASDPVIEADGVTIADQVRIEQAVQYRVSNGTAGQEHRIKVTGVFDDGSVNEEYAVLPVRVPG